MQSVTGTEAEALRKQSEKLHRELQRQIIEFNEERDERLLKAQKKGKKKSKLQRKKQKALFKNFVNCVKPNLQM